MNDQQQSQQAPGNWRLEVRNPSEVIRTYEGKVVRLPRAAGVALIVGILALALFLPSIIGGLIYSLISSSSAGPDAWAIFFIALLGASTLTFGLLIYYILQSFAARKWATTTGIVVLSKEIRVRDHGRRPLVLYRYQIGEQVYESSSITVAGNTRGGSKYNAQILGQFPAGKWVPVYYNPKNPRRSALVWSSRTTIVPLIILTVILFAATASMLAWRVLNLGEMLR